MPSNPLTDRYVLVTGASRGIGRAVAVEAARRGACVIALARTVGGLEELDDEITSAGGKAVLIPADLSHEDSLARLPGALEERFGRLDGMVLNAGLLGPLTPVADLSGREWHETLTVNLHANLALLKLLDPLLLNSDAGRVVGITSRAARTHKPYWGAYAASKAAFDVLVRTYASEHAETNVRANLLDPGPTATDMRANAMPGEDPSTITAPAKIAEWVANLLDPATDKTAEIVVYPRPDGV
ncbi:MAG: SDR family NAD(P)-dependent oxidoreductase [Pseudomonadota bacterium]